MPGDVLREGRGDEASRSRTLRYARFERLRNHAVTSAISGSTSQRRQREAPVEQEEHDGGADQEQRVLDRGS